MEKKTLPRNSINASPCIHIYTYQTDLYYNSNYTTMCNAHFTVLADDGGTADRRARETLNIIGLE